MTMRLITPCHAEVARFQWPSFRQVSADWFRFPFGGPELKEGSRLPGVERLSRLFVVVRPRPFETIPTIQPREHPQCRVISMQPEPSLRPFPGSGLLRVAAVSS